MVVAVGEMGVFCGKMVGVFGKMTAVFATMAGVFPSMATIFTTIRASTAPLWALIHSLSVMPLSSRQRPERQQRGC